MNHLLRVTLINLIHAELGLMYNKDLLILGPQHLQLLLNSNNRHALRRHRNNFSILQQ